MANAIFFCTILPFNAIIFSGAGFWVADIFGAALAFIFTTLWLGSARKVLPQASQRASQRDHCGKTPGELVVTGANSPVLF